MIHLSTEILLTHYWQQYSVSRLYTGHNTVNCTRFSCAVDFYLPLFLGVAINSDLETKQHRITEMRDIVKQKKKVGKQWEKERWNTKESWRNKESRKKLGFGHTGLSGMLLTTGKHATGRCGFLEFETVEHIYSSEKYKAEKKKLVRNLKRINQLSVEMLCQKLQKRNFKSKISVFKRNKNIWAGYRHLFSFY